MAHYLKLFFSIVLLFISLFLIVDTFYIQKVFLSGFMSYLFSLTALWIILLITTFIIKFITRKNKKLYFISIIISVITLIVQCGFLFVLTGLASVSDW